MYLWDAFHMFIGESLLVSIQCLGMYCLCLNYGEQLISGRAVDVADEAWYHESAQGCAVAAALVFCLGGEGIGEVEWVVS